MKTFHITKLCLLTLFFPLTVMAQQTEQIGTLELTLPRAIEIALAENPTIRVADKDVELKKIADK